MPNCRSCGANIKWVKTQRGKNMPIDVESIDPAAASDGDFIVSQDGQVIKVGSERAPEIDTNKTWHISHFATCPNADAHRK